MGIGTKETVRKWVLRAQIDSGARAGVTTEQAAEIARLKREDAELRRASEILKAPSVFFAAALDRPGETVISTGCLTGATGCCESAVPH